MPASAVLYLKLSNRDARKAALKNTALMIVLDDRLDAKVWLVSISHLTCRATGLPETDG